MRLERRAHRPFALVVASPIIAIVAALAISGVLIALAGAPVFEAYYQIVVGSFGSKLAVTETLTRATPLIFTGLAAAVAFRAQVWNIGAEGQFYIGAIAVAAFGAQATAGLPAAMAIPLLMLIGAIAGMVVLLLPLGLRLRFGVDEVVTTLLLNFVAVLFVSMMIEGPLKDPLAFGWPQSVPVADNAILPKLIERSRLHIGLIVAIAIAIVVHLVQARTVFGMQSKAAGLNPKAARFAGVPLASTLIKVACLSGGLAGLAGAVEVMGVKGYVTTDLSPRLRLFRHHRRHARQPPPDRRHRGRPLHRRHVRRRRRHEPGDRHPELYRRRHRRAVALDHAGGAVLHAVQDSQVMEILDIFASAGLWAAVLRIATPLIFGTLGALLCERAGVLNLGIEGIMTFGAMAGWLAVFNGADLWTGLLVAALCGALFGLLHAALTVTLGLSQHVTGLGITLFSSSLSYFLFRLIVPIKGTPPTIVPFQPIDIPGLSDLPFIGPALFTQTAPTYVAIALAIVLGYVLFFTPLGLAVRMTGENPHAAEAQGVNPITVRYGAIMAGSALMGGGGAFLTLSAFNSFFPTMIQGPRLGCASRSSCFPRGGRAGRFWARFSSRCSTPTSSGCRPWSARRCPISCS